MDEMELKNERNIFKKESNRDERNGMDSKVDRINKKGPEHTLKMDGIEIKETECIKEGWNVFNSGLNK
jgi:hypothetical protein